MGSGAIDGEMVSAAAALGLTSATRAMSGRNRRQLRCARWLGLSPHAVSFPFRVRGTDRPTTPVSFGEPASPRTDLAAEDGRGSAPFKVLVRVLAA